MVFGQTILPAFVIMTDRGLKILENAKVLSFDDNTNTFPLDNEKEQLQLPNLAFNVDKIFGSEKDKVFENLTVISASKVWINLAETRFYGF